MTELFRAVGVVLLKISLMLLVVALAACGFVLFGAYLVS